MISNKRWSKAQAYEKRHWQKTADKIISGAIAQLSWYGWKAEQFENKIDNFFDFSSRQDCGVLEVGSGPIGIVAFLKWGQKYAIDPLEHYFSDNPPLTSQKS